METKPMATVKQIQRLHMLYRKRGMDNDAKKAMLYDLTDGRTNTSKELTYKEALYLMGYLNGSIAEAPLSGGERELKSRRSAVLKRIQLLGVNTTSWDNVNEFCLDKRIAGKVFYELNIDELKGLVPKLEAIIKKEE